MNTQEKINDWKQKQANEIRNMLELSKGEVYDLRDEKAVVFETFIIVSGYVCPVDKKGRCSLLAGDDIPYLSLSGTTLFVEKNQLPGKPVFSGNVSDYEYFVV